MTRIGYAKLGRCMEFDRTKFGFQGDAEAPNLLLRLAERNPDVEWVIVGKNDRCTQGLPANITNPWPVDADWFRNGPVQHINSVKPDRMSSMITIENSPSYLINDMRSYNTARDVTRMIAELDGMIVHVGQHGTCSGVIPLIGHTWDDVAIDPVTYGTNPQAWTRNYEEFLVDGLNRLGDRTNGRAPVAWIVTDPRNYLKTRSVKWPTGLGNILAQYEYQRHQRHDRHGDARTPYSLNFSDIAETDSDACHSNLWRVRHTYRYGGLELMILPDDWETWGPAGYDDRQTIGVATTSFNVGRRRRSEYVRDYLVNAWPDVEVFGKWDAVSLVDIADHPVARRPPHEFPSHLNRWRCTIALPPLDTGWSTAKPFQCFAARTVCFMIEQLDEQGWIIPTRCHNDGTHYVGQVNGRNFYSIRDDWTEEDLWLAAWLRVDMPSELSERVDMMGPVTWRVITDWQRNLLARRWNKHYTERLIEKQLGLTSA
jgi:hypothetical protein